MEIRNYVVRQVTIPYYENDKFKFYLDVPSDDNTRVKKLDGNSFYLRKRSIPITEIVLLGRSELDEIIFDDQHKFIDTVFVRVIELILKLPSIPRFTDYL